MMSQEAHLVVLEASRLGRKRKETKRLDRPMDKLGKQQIRVDNQGTIQDLLALRGLVLLDRDRLDLVLRDLVLRDLGIIQDPDLPVVLEVATVDREVDRELQKIKRSPMQKR